MSLRLRIPRLFCLVRSLLLFLASGEILCILCKVDCYEMEDCGWFVILDLLLIQKP